MDCKDIAYVKHGLGKLMYKAVGMVGYRRI